MTSTEKDEVSLSAIKPQCQHVPREDADPHEDPKMISLRRSSLRCVPDFILGNHFLTYLCLEGNQISTIPGSMFVLLPQLQWLDLRNNLIMILPPEIGSHRSLETLLLEGNPISELPLELGNVMTLRGLNLRDCPLHFPPQDIVQQGYQSILGYLRSLAASAVVENLQLSELMGSSMEEQDESGDEDGLQRFRELKSKLILLDDAELSLTVHGVKMSKSNRSSVTKIKKTTTKTSVAPKHWKRLEDRRQVLMKELREKQALLNQRRTSLEALQKWCKQVKIKQEKKVSEHKSSRREGQRTVEAGLGDSTHSHAQMSGLSIEDEEDRLVWKLERDICIHVERMQERIPRATVAEQAAAAEDVEEMRKLQARLLERKKNFRKHLENSWPRFL